MNGIRNGVQQSQQQQQQQQPQQTQQQKPKNIREYICSLNAATIDKLYVKSSANCLAVFRELPLLSKHYVMRLLFVEQAIPQAVVSSWLKQDSIK